ncbi:unnamed protein product, partial [Darwinula stevensoni]
GRDVGYQALNGTCNRLARLLRERVEAGRREDPLVAVCMEPSHLLVISLMAVLKTGCSYLPLDPKFPAERISHILRDADPICVLKSGESRGLEEGKGFHQVYDVESLLKESKDLEPEDLPDDMLIPIKNEDRLAAVLYTSGSTGVPKGVRLPHRVVLNRLHWQWETFPYGEDEVCCFKTALTFVDSISEIFGPLCQGRSLVVVPREISQNVQEFLEEIRENEVRRLVLVPTLLQAIVLYIRSTKAWDAVGSLRLWVCSGETLSKKALMDFFQLFPEGHTLCNFYGSTEVMGDVAWEAFRSRPEALAKTRTGKVSVGRPVHNTSIYVLDGDLRPVAEGDMGEIFVAGRNLAALYVRVGAAGKFLANPYIAEGEDYSILYRTGDYGRVVDDRVVFEGRTDSQVKVRGHRVDLSEIEAALSKVPAVAKATVLCYHPGGLDQV